jgi:ribosomal protein S5
VVKATFEALKQLRNESEYRNLRGTGTSEESEGGEA